MKGIYLRNQFVKMKNKNKKNNLAYIKWTKNIIIIMTYMKNNNKTNPNNRIKRQMKNKRKYPNNKSSISKLYRIIKIILNKQMLMNWRVTTPIQHNMKQKNTMIQMLYINVLMRIIGKIMREFMMIITMTHLMLIGDDC